MTETRQLSRQDLYELVWAAPVTKIAAEFGISDVALHKICEKHRVPVPGRGYWAKLAAGNPKGRPKGAKNRKTIVKVVANEMHSVTEAGKRRRLSTLELVLLSLRNMALEGKNVRAFDELHRLIKVYQPQETDDNCGYLVVPAVKTPEEAIAEGEKANAEARARREARLQSKS